MAPGHARGGPGVPAMAAVGGLALVVAFGLVAVGAAAQRQASGTPRVHGFWQTAVTRSGLVRVGQMAYSIFLINFPVCLLINAVVSRWWSGQLLANVLGLLAAFTLSLFAGGVRYRNVEIRQSPRCAHPVLA